MEYNFQVGSLAWHRAKLNGMDLQISNAGIWHSLNDHFNYRLHPDGYGQFDITSRRKTVTSDFFEGEYTVRKTPDAVKRNLSIWVYGGTQVELETNLQNLLDWFSEDEYNIRTMRDEFMETWLCESADFTIDGSQVFMHNGMYLVKARFNADPLTTREQIM